MKVLEEIYYDYVSDVERAQDFDETKEIEKEVWDIIDRPDKTQEFFDFENKLVHAFDQNEKQGFIKGFLHAGRLLGAALALNDEDAIYALRCIFAARKSDS